MSREVESGALRSRVEGRRLLKAGAAGSCRSRRRREELGVAALRIGFFSALLLAISCHSTPIPGPGNAVVWGHVQLVPRQGVVPQHPGSAGYADRALRDVELVDYSRPGWAVVETEGPAPDDPAEFAIRKSNHRVRLEPEFAVAGRMGSVTIRNETDVAFLVSDPVEGIVRSLAAGETWSLSEPVPGHHRIHVLHEAGVRSDLFVASGPFARTSERGRYLLSGLAPGSHDVRAWHPRFARVSHQIEIVSGERRRLDISLGVDVAKEVVHDGK